MVHSVFMVLSGGVAHPASMVLSLGLAHSLNLVLSVLLVYSLRMVLSSIVVHLPVTVLSRILVHSPATGTLIMNDLLLVYGTPLLAWLTHHFWYSLRSLAHLMVLVPLPPFGSFLNFGTLCLRDLLMQHGTVGILGSHCIYGSLSYHGLLPNPGTLPTSWLTQRPRYSSDLWLTLLLAVLSHLMVYSAPWYSPYFGSLHLDGTLSRYGSLCLNGTLCTDGSLPFHGAVVELGLLNTFGTLRGVGLLTMYGSLDATGSLPLTGTLSYFG